MPVIILGTVCLCPLPAFPLRSPFYSFWCTGSLNGQGVCPCSALCVGAGLPQVATYLLPCRWASLDGGRFCFSCCGAHPSSCPAYGFRVFRKTFLVAPTNCINVYLSFLLIHVSFFCHSISELLSVMDGSMQQGSGFVFSQINILLS